MKNSICLFLALGALTLRASAATTINSANHFAYGANTGWHKHGHDYVVVPLMDGKVRLETPTGPAHAEMKAGVPYFRHAGVEHDVINANDTEYAFIEIELK